MYSVVYVIVHLLFLNTVISLHYKHTTYVRQLNTPSTSQHAPGASNEVEKVEKCGEICHFSPTCALFFFNGTHCVTYSETMQFDGGGAESLTYFTQATSVFHSDIAGQMKSECTSNGYIYDPLVPLCYKVNTIALTKSAAETSCHQNNGHLLRINTYRKQLLVESLNLQSTGSVSKYRIDGERQADSTWTFSDGREIAIFYWYPGEPRRNFKSIALRTSYEGKWDDVLESNAHGFICEWTPSIL
ncbi:uncharacterized protein LOC125681521 isoform X1 [Ostrea edulis]|uniref:uncharacterized protein LOC125681521 isoform X1 n=1 Tax=Ostrea edulis TaxID=37623 RepID=UPI0024AF57CF|nr:uncharacterized protein LOC125681521 isoform X1 [Ostrea edulis]